MHLLRSQRPPAAASRILGCPVRIGRVQTFDTWSKPSSTGGCACHSSGLSVQSFLRGIHVVDYSRDALAEVAHHVVTLAEAEDLPAHGTALKARFEWKVPQSK